MCGVAGMFEYRGSVPACHRQEVNRITAAMAARGQDGAGSWQSEDARLHLGHRRLAVIAPGARADQPMHSACGRFVISFNGEIYNHRALRADLEARGARLRNGSDTETILALYARHGAEACAKLHGMFAFAIYDTVERSLFLARDPYGIKPLYLSDDGKVLRFASQVKALLAGGAIDPAPDPAGVAGFALFGHVPEPFTLHRAISALPAGHHLIVRNGEPGAPVRFAQLAEPFAQPQREVPDASGICRQAVRDSVYRHLEADVALGVFLSGGVDSGAVLGLMRDHLGNARRIPAITIAFDDLSGTPLDEVAVAGQLAARYNADHHVHRVSRRDLEAALPAILAAMDQPSIDGINTWFAARAAREAGLKVMLTGIGGDELLGGYSTFRTVPATVRTARMASAVPGFGKMARRLGTAMLPALQRANPKALAAFELGGSFPGAYLLRRGLFMPHELPELLGPELAREGLARLDPLGLIARTMNPCPVDPALRVAALESGNYLRNQLLRDADWAGMAHGVEIRTPLVDFLLLETVAPHLGKIIRSGTGKALLASTPATALPATVVQQPKTGFSVPIASLLAGETTANSRLTSRQWACTVLAAFTANKEALAA